MKCWVSVLISGYAGLAKAAGWLVDRGVCLNSRAWRGPVTHWEWFFSLLARVWSQRYF